MSYGLISLPLSTLNKLVEQINFDCKNKNNVLVQLSDDEYRYGQKIIVAKWHEKSSSNYSTVFYYDE